MRKENFVNMKLLHRISRRPKTALKIREMSEIWVRAGSQIPNSFLTVNISLPSSFLIKFEIQQLRNIEYPAAMTREVLTKAVAG